MSSCIHTTMTFLQIFLLLVVLLLRRASDVVDAAGSTTTRKPMGKILVVGATGTTGLRAIQGLLDLGYRPKQLRLLTRNARSQKCLALKRVGFDIVQADLDDDPSSLLGKGIIKGCTGCYVHSTSSDRAELDTGEVERAEHLASVIEHDKNNDITCVVYNSAAAQDDHGVARIAQKHDVEKVFQRLVKRYNNNNKIGEKLSFTSLRCNIFMEELWKIYTRPSILRGQYPLPVSTDRKIYLISVRDLGRLAGYTIMMNSEKLQKLHKKSLGDDEDDDFIRTINIAGDYLSARDIAHAFGAAQGTPCEHCNPRFMTLKAWWKFPELYEQIRFLQTFKVKTDVDELNASFPGLLTNFKDFLEETQWGDRNRSFATFSEISNLKL